MAVIKRFAGYPSVFVLDKPGGEIIQHLLWGDWVSVLEERADGWTKIHSRGCDGWVPDDRLQEEQLLEVNFVDIAQGDGCFIVTPDDKFILIDAGQSDNMFRFLRWRFGLKKNPKRKIKFDVAIMSHPDSDHYAGFEPLFDSERFQFKRLYHNGIVERSGSESVSLGPTEKVGKITYLTDIVADRKRLEAIVNDPSVVGKGLLARVMRKALACADDIRMLSAEDEFVPGYEKKELKLQVLAPVTEKVGRKRALRRFGSKKGPTKNGHSVVIKLFYKGVRMILGGDLNIPAEEYLLEHYAGGEAGGEETTARAREVFEADVAKACHHGSADLSIDYLKAVNPIATIVSSGDDEPHCHPRPDALGAFGRYGRGERPLIFSTELARSAPDRLKDPNQIRSRVNELLALRDAAKDDERRNELTEKIDSELDLDRTVAVYGMINVRTDGEKIVVAQRLERPRENTSEKWDIHRIERHGADLVYVSKH